jgi:hypothetical protein
MQIYNEAAIHWESFILITTAPSNRVSTGCSESIFTYAQEFKAQKLNFDIVLDQVGWESSYY